MIHRISRFKTTYTETTAMQKCMAVFISGCFFILYVLEQMTADSDLNIYYYTNERGSCEIDFVIDDGEHVVPVEVKAEENLQAKSLKTFRDKYAPEISVRTSMSGYRKEEWMVNIPLYMIGNIRSILYDAERS